MKLRPLFASIVMLLIIVPAARSSALNELVVDDDLSCPGATYATIGAAVAAASAGDEITVCAGAYTETGIVLDKAISIIGDTTDGSVSIDAGGAGPVFTITASAVFVSFLEIIDAAVGIEVETAGPSHVHLTEVVIWNASDAAVLVPAGSSVDELALDDSIPIGDGGDGIRIDPGADVDRLHLRGGYVSGRRALDVADAQSVILDDVYISSSTVDVRRAGSVIVVNGVLDEVEIVAGSGAPDADSDTSVTDVTFRNNYILYPSGPVLDLRRTFDAQIVDNTVFVHADELTTSDPIIAVDVSDGIFGDFRRRRIEPVRIEENNIRYTGSLSQVATSAAIGLSGALRSVVVSNNGLRGIDVQEHVGARPYAGILIEAHRTRGDINVAIGGDTISGFHAGLLIDGGALPEGASVSARGVSFTGNDWGILNGDGGAAIDARCNWWGDPLGPTGEGSGLMGDAVSTDVSYSPWLPAPVEQAAIACDLL